MRIIITKDYDHMSEIAAELVKDMVKDKPSMSFCLPAGGSPIGMYEALVRDASKVDFSSMRVCQMDEYVGLERSHNQSYYYFAQEKFLKHIKYDHDNSEFINGLATDLDKECHEYNQKLDKLQLDLAISGIGLNGHMAFNEPNDYLVARTHVVDLHPTTIESNSRFFTEEETVPTKAFTVGIGELMQARHLMIVASGKNKAEVVAKLLSDDHISTSFPVSFLKSHQNVTLIVDEEAISETNLDRKFGFKHTIEKA